MRILFSALGELRVDDAAELMGSLTSMPLSCWSPLSLNLTSCPGIVIDGAVLAMLMGVSQAFTVGIGAGIDMLVTENGVLTAAEPVNK